MTQPDKLTDEELIERIAKIIFHTLDSYMENYSPTTWEKLGEDDRSSYIRPAKLILEEIDRNKDSGHE